jgi:hypothetical protein
VRRQSLYILGGPFSRLGVRLKAHANKKMASATSDSKERWRFDPCVRGSLTKKRLPLLAKVETMEDGPNVCSSCCLDGPAGVSGSDLQGRTDMHSKKMWLLCKGTEGSELTWFQGL